jgi:hypothetical protein
MHDLKHAESWPARFIVLLLKTLYVRSGHAKTKSKAYSPQRKAIFLFMFWQAGINASVPGVCQDSACNVPYASLRFFLCVLCVSVVNSF